MRCYVSGQARFARDMELRSTTNGKKVLNNAIAFEGNDRESSVFLEVVAWEKNAENISTFFKKGDAIVINSAQLLSRTDEYEGTARTKIFARIDLWDFPGTRKADKREVEKLPEEEEDEHL